ncbi:hypothetical protein AMS68_004034 [Peltaster fructicola]|uniref:SANT domain-containing protein n=1 Tax=Peltaster fructicola TaxID=286661 RepID=A0A6H0XUT0_9PEZI|nr:hypothetical protein AMS68_004034 [Peltaster fructicola]
MSRYPPNDFRGERRASPPRWSGDRRGSYHDAPRGRGGRDFRDAPPQLRDAPPLGARNSFREPRDFSPRDLRDEPVRARRNSRDGPLSAGAPYESPSFRGGFGRGRGDGGFRGGRGGRGRFPDDRDLFPRDRSPRDRSPPFYRREDRSPDRRDERPYPRREEPRWPDRDRELDRTRRDPQRPELRQIDTGPSPAALVNPDRLALIEDAIESPSRRPAMTPSSAVPGRRESEIPGYINARVENTNNRYNSRASSPPTQPPPVPAFTVLHAAPQNIPKPPEAKPVAAPTSIATPSENVQKSPLIPTAPRAATADAPPAAPRAPRAESDAQSRSARPWDGGSIQAPTQPRAAPVSPTMHATSRPGVIAAPTGPKADRALSQPSVSPRLSFTAAPLTMTRSRSPPPTAPTGPRGHALSHSPEITFAAAPTAPKADRAPPSAPRVPISVRTNDRSAPPGVRGPQSAPGRGWNQWRREEPAVNRQDFGVDSSRARDSKFEAPRTAAPQRDDKMELDPAPQPAKAPVQQSFFGKPSSEMEAEQETIDAADDSLSTTDDDEIEDQDLALFKAKFVRQRRELEAKLIDLSLQRYRATTPLENLARVPRITMKDVEKFNSREIEMDVDEPPRHIERSVPPAAQSSESEEGADLLTPQGEEDTSVMIHDADEPEVARRIRRPSPDVVTLPFILKDSQMAFDETEEYKQGQILYEAAQDDMTSALKNELSTACDSDSKLEADFADYYRRWRVECEELDYEREEQERMERQASFEPGPEPEPPLSASLNPIVEGRRLHKFSSEYEIEQVLKESKEMARIEQEKADREAKKTQADMEKEAIVPDQLSAKEFQRSLFIDNNTLCEPETLTVVFAYEPAPDDFTDQEQQIFVAAFKETPKKWSEIASLLPGREPKDCIRHYYANKWDGRFRDAKARRFKGVRRGRGGGPKGPRSKGAAAMADLARADEGPVATNDNGRPKRAAAPTTFAERETENKAILAGQSPAKRPNTGKDGQDPDKPVKRRRAAGAQASRKPKGAQPLASLAAAPNLSPDGRSVQQTHVKESEMSARLEEASLLTGFSAGRPALPNESQAPFGGDPYMARQLDDPNRMRPPLQGQSAKSNTSSYWSVPEQNDFNKYIKHFGTDFAAIALHMGTKSQTMIKNHYSRQVENRPDLERDALAANARKQRGEDIGAPPVPTPITKRKYDQPPTAPRSLVQHGDAMDIDDGIGSRASIKQHGSPPQFGMRPQYQPALQADRGQSDTSGTPTLAPSVPTRQFQPRMSIFSDPRAEGRSSLSAAPSYMPPLGTPTAQPSRPGPDSGYIQSLLDQQKQAIQMQGQYSGDRMDFSQPRGPLGSLQHSPASQPALLHIDRKQLDARPSPPPMGSFFGSKGGSSTSRAYDSLRYSTQHAVAPQPPKREDSRTSIGSSATFLQPSQPADPPKRSNVMSLLNDTEDPKPAKRNSMEVPTAAAIPRHGSPAQHGGVPPPAFGNVSQPYNAPGQPQYARSSLAAPPVSSALKQEPLSASSSGIQSSIPPKHDWPARSSAHGTHTPPAGPSYERGGRPPFQPYHSSMLGSLGTPNRANPSPPPLGGLQHSRTPSLPTAEPHRPPYTASLPQSSMYQQQQQGPPPFAQTPSSQAPAHDHPAHSSSLTPGYPAMHQRVSSRDERPSGQFFRERDREWRFSRDEDVERRREGGRAPEPRQYEQDHSYRAPMPPQRIHTAYSGYESGRHDSGMNMREQSIREAHIAMQHEEERLRSTGHYREQDQADEARRRHDDAYMSGARRTPLGGGFGASNLPTNRR